LYLFGLASYQAFVVVADKNGDGKIDPGEFVAASTVQLPHDP
jgi:hypothetical protein